MRSKRTKYGSPSPTIESSTATESKWDLMSSSNLEVLRSYRNLYRHGLRAVRYSSPARYTLRDYLQHAFRTGIAIDLNIQKVENTIQFLINAGRDNGLEHRILKNLLHVRWWQAQTRLHRKRLVFGREHLPVKH